MAHESAGALEQPLDGWGRCPGVERGQGGAQEEWSLDHGLVADWWPTIIGFQSQGRLEWVKHSQHARREAECDHSRSQGRQAGRQQAEAEAEAGGGRSVRAGKSEKKRATGGKTGQGTVWKPSGGLLQDRGD